MRDWEAFQRKISAGTLPEIAASEAGIPWHEAEAWLKESRPRQEFDEDGLRLVAARSIALAMEALESLSQNRDGRISMSAVGPGMTESTVYHDLDAAKALLDGALKIRRLLQGSKKVAADEPRRDLFDSPSRTRSPWSFRKAE